MSELALKPIARLRGPYGQKFGIPRQSGLANEVESIVEFDESVVGPESIRGLEKLSHLWLIFGFSEHFDSTPRDTVRPPRLGGQTRIGVFASRSPYRPNHLGLSLVELRGIDFPRLRIAGADLLDGTPIYDIKPYLPWAESKPDARCEWAPSAPPRLAVEFSSSAREALALLPNAAELERVLVDTLCWDPRPRYGEDAGRSFKSQIAGVDVEFRVQDQGLEILSLARVD